MSSAGPSPAAAPPPKNNNTTTPPSSPPPPPSNPSPPPPSTPSTPLPPPPPSTSTSPSIPSTSLPPARHSSWKISTVVYVGLGSGALLAILVLCILCICCRKKKRPPHPPKDASSYWENNDAPPPHCVIHINPNPSPSPRHPLTSSGASGSGLYNASDENPLQVATSAGIVLGFSRSKFTYEELARATDAFSDSNLLGQGGFGYVHKGFLPNGKEVAIKQLKAGSGQGEREFQAEVEIISRVHHRHLVTLVGYCITGTKRLLVYEFVPNNTLEFHLHGKELPTMDWSTRLKIALGAAKGLAYLHEDCHPKIIHRDIKAANILLDSNFEPKVADFGLAKFSSDLNTHVSTRVMGTFGYLAPEYAASGKLTEKSDVFSYGVMLLELITGRRPVDSSHSLVDWARPLLTRALEDQNFDPLIDPRLQDEYEPSEMTLMVACAAASIRHSAKHRPRMSQIARALEGDASLEDLNDGVKPGHNRSYSSRERTDYEAAQY